MTPVLDIALLDMGGTINGFVDPDAAPPGERRLMRYLQQQAQALHIRIGSAVEVCWKDSRQIDASDRHSLLEHIIATPEQAILVAHGTYTMAETGIFLLRSDLTAASDKTVVLFGSNVPLGESGSDAADNIAFAVHSLRTTRPGIWIAMSGRVWHPREVRKNLQTGAFEYRRPPRQH